MLTLSDVRRLYRPKIPSLLEGPKAALFEPIPTSPVDPAVQPYFPLIKNIQALRGVQGSSSAPKVRVGVLFSGGPAPGGHNVVAGVFDTAGSVVGFLGGPEGLLTGAWRELKASEIDHYRNQGGFDLLGTGRTKIETVEQFQSALNGVKKLKLDALIIIGGDDSNTNAALLAEYFLKEKCPTCVIGVPKTIDGDLQNPYVPISFGFDTAAKVYSEMIGNLARDTISSLKYFHFVKLMGRSASHLTLECALKTHPNVTLISEEKRSFVHELADWVESRQKTPYGIVLVPEGLLEGMVDPSLPKDEHGNVNLSSLETEEFVIEAVHKELKERGFKGRFDPLSHFYGYEGRCGHPSNFDANYSYALGVVAALLAAHKKTGQMAYVGDLHKAPSEWSFGGAPLAALMKMEERKGVLKPVIHKALVDLEGKPYKTLQKHRSAWLNHSHYQNPGPIQFEGDPQVTDSIPLILQ